MKLCRFSLVPRESCEEQAHSAEVRDASEHEPGTDKGRETEEAAVNKPAENYPDHHEGTGGDAHLALQTDDSDSAAHDRQISLYPGKGSSLDHNNVTVTGLGKFGRGLFCAPVGAAKEIDGLVAGNLMGLNQRFWVEVIEWFVTGLGNVDFIEFDRRADIEQGEVRFGLQLAMEFGWRDKTRR